MKYEIKRLWLSLLNKWKPNPDGSWDGIQNGRKSDYKGYLGELGHSFKNVFVEALRKTGIYDRPSQPDGK